MKTRSSTLKLNTHAKGISLWLTITVYGKISFKMIPMPKRLFYVDLEFSKIMPGFLKILMETIFLRLCHNLLLNTLYSMENKFMKDYNLNIMIESFWESIRSFCSKISQTLKKGPIKGTKTKNKLAMNLPSIKDKKNSKMKVLFFTPIVPHQERDLPVRLLFWRTKKWSLNCNKLNKNLLNWLKKIKKEHAKNRLDTNKDSLNFKNKNNSNKKKN